MVTVADTLTLKPALDDYLEDFEPCIHTFPSKRHLGTYVSGQIGPLGRKTVEGIALEAGVAPRTLQQFMGKYRWDEEAVKNSTRVPAWSKTGETTVMSGRWVPPAYGEFTR